MDHGAGTGQVARTIHKARPVLHVHCLDPSAAFLTAAPQPPTDPWATVQLGTAADLEPEPRFIGAISNLVLPFVKNPVDDLCAIRRSLATGSRLVAVSLGEAEEVEPFFAFWSTLAKVSQETWMPERYVHFRFGKANDLEQVFEQAGFVDVKIKTIIGHRPIKADSVWKWLVTEMPVGIGDSYATPPAGMMAEAADRFMADFGTKTMWNTRCRMAVGCVGDR